MAPKNRKSSNLSLEERVTNRLAARGINVVFQSGAGVYTYNNPADIPVPQVFGATPRQVPTGVTPQQDRRNAVLGTIDRLSAPSVPSAPSAAAAAAASSDSSKMANQEDDGIPKVKFPPKPEGWKGDPGNPNFKTLGTLSPPVMRKIEPYGPHFLAFARRVSPCNQLPPPLLMNS